MPNHSPLAIANEFLRRHSGTTIPAQVQLQKLVYVAHGWNLAVNGAPLVSEMPEAWDNGPVFRTLWNHMRDFGFGSRTGLLEDPLTRRPIKEALAAEEAGVIEHVWSRYRHYTGLELSRMTHEPGTPWTGTYFTRGRNAPIPNELVRRYYTDLALSGRARG